MLRHFVILGLLASGLTGAAVAQSDCSCGGTRVNGRALIPLLAGKTACARLGDDRWQEFHSGSTDKGGPLIDYKQGPNHPVDPSETIGTWAIVSSQSAGGTIVRYDYGGTAHRYQVCQTGSMVNFCGVEGTPTNITGATLLSGQMRCP